MKIPPGPFWLITKSTRVPIKWVSNPKLLYHLPHGHLISITDKRKHQWEIENNSLSQTPMFMSNFKSRWGPLKTGIANALVYPVADSPGELISVSVLWFCILKGFSGLDSTHLLRYPRKSFLLGIYLFPYCFRAICQPIVRYGRCLMTTESDCGELSSQSPFLPARKHPAWLF